jgi:hypothetical protein
MKWKCLALKNETKTLYSSLNCNAFTFLSFSQRPQISEECNKDVKLASREPNGFIVSSWFMAPAGSRSDFIIENYSMKKQGTIFTICIKLTRKNYK